MKYTCDKCLRSFSKKYNYELHLKRKIPCKPKNINNIDLDNKNIFVTDNNVILCNPASSMCNPASSNEYICLICNKKFKYRQGLYKHKKTHTNYENDITQNKNEYIDNINIVRPNDSKMDQIDSKMELKCNPINSCNECLICHKMYSNKSSFNKHKKIKHKNYEEDLQRIAVNTKNNEDIILLKNKLEQTENKIEQLNEEYKNISQTSKSKKSKIIKNTNTSNNTTNNINNNTTNNTQNNVIVNNNYIVNFGEEDLTKLTIDDKREILNSGSQIYPTLISKIYLNEKIPQNNCIRITNLRSDDMFIMEDGVFVAVNKKKTMEDLLSNMSIFAKRTFEEIIKSKEEIEQDRNNINEKEFVEVNNENYELVKVINTHGMHEHIINNMFMHIGMNNTNGMQKQIKRKHKKPEIMLSEGQKESIKEQIMFIYRFDITGEDDDAEGVIKCTPINLKRYSQIKKDSEIKIYNFRNKIDKNIINK